ncbi:MAG: radical SAM protein, partial [Synergistaceae bacterium]
MKNKSKFEVKIIFKKRCTACPHNCDLADNEVGLCNARKNINGKVKAINYGRLTVMSLDPVSKYIVNNGFHDAKILSIGSYGCNMRCLSCGSPSIAKATSEKAKTRLVRPDDLTEVAYSLKPKGNIGVAFTHNEPLIAYEYVRDCAKTLHKRGMKSIVMTNGFISLQALEEIMPWTDAISVTLDGFSSLNYEKQNINIERIKNFIKKSCESLYTEIEVRLPQNSNESAEEIETFARWVASI